MNQKNAESMTQPSSQSRAPGGVLRMVDSGQSVSYTAEALGISEALIYGWKNKNKMGKEKSVHQSDLLAENQKLKERVHQLEAEREILKKARRAAPLSIFSGAAPAARADGVLRLDRLLVQRVCGQHALLGAGSHGAARRPDGLLPLQERR